MRGGAELLATFAVLMWPVRVDGVQLVRCHGSLRLWTPTRDLRFMSAAERAIIVAAQETAHQAIEAMEMIGK